MPEKSSPIPEKTAAYALSVVSLSSDGRGVGFLDSASGKGKTVFIDGGLPGETVLCRTVKAAKNFIDAVSLEVLQPRPVLQPPHCHHSGVCGGCSLQRLPYSEQIFWKEKILADAMTRIGHLPVKRVEDARLPIAEAPLLKAFRNKVEFAFGYDAAGMPAFGFRQAGSHAVFTVTDCAIVDKRSIEIGKSFADLALASHLPVYKADKGYWRFLVLRETSDKPARKIVLCITSPASARDREKTACLGSKLLETFPEIQAFIHEERKSDDYFAIGQRRLLTLDRQKKMNPEAALFCRSLGGKQFRLDAGSFFQVNASASEILMKIIQDMAGSGDHLLDLYSGVGTPGLLIADKFNSVTCLEADRKAVGCLRKNAVNFKIRNCEAVAATAGCILSRLEKTRIDLCVLDPPRAGLSSEAMTTLLKLSPERIIYISCNPATLARDAGLLARDYELKTLTGVDLFPHTPHLEALSLWIKKQRSQKFH